MSIELQMLAWSTILGLAQIALTALALMIQRGTGWAVGPRDEPRPALAGMGGRLDRARANFLETFPFFAALALAVVARGRQDAMTALGAQLYFWARVVYVPMYMAGIPYLRSLVWGVSIVGIVMLLGALL